MNQNSLTAYEQQQLEKLQAWQAEPPGWLTRRLASASGPVARAAQNLIPVPALKLALNSANGVAARLANADRVLKLAGVESLEALRDVELERCDTLAQKVRRQSVGLSAAGGVLTGVAGAPGLVLDVPALLTLALHNIHRTGLCYGYDSLGAEDRPYAIAVFALASANTAEEKQLALDALRAEQEPDAAAFRDGMERAAQRELGKSAAVYSLHNLSRQLGLNLGRRKAASAIPVLGAIVGGAVNAWYLNDLSQTARYAFHLRRFVEKGAL